MWNEVQNISSAAMNESSRKLLLVVKDSLVSLQVKYFPESLIESFPLILLPGFKVSFSYITRPSRGSSEVLSAMRL